MTLQKNGQNRDSCDSDSRSRHNPILEQQTELSTIGASQKCRSKDLEIRT